MDDLGSSPCRWGSKQPTEHGKGLYFLRWHFESDDLEQSSVPILRALPPMVALNLLIHMQVGLMLIGAVLGLQSQFKDCKLALHHIKLTAISHNFSALRKRSDILLIILTIGKTTV